MYTETCSTFGEYLPGQVDLDLSKGKVADTLCPVGQSSVAFNRDVNYAFWGLEPLKSLFLVAMAFVAGQRAYGYPIWDTMWLSSIIFLDAT
jgi:hypothetical protein